MTDPPAQADETQEAEVKRPVRLNDQRLAAVLDALEATGGRRIIDLGCGQGSLLGHLLDATWVDQVVGVDVSWQALEAAARRLHLADLAPPQRARVELWQAALTCCDRRLRHFDAAAVVEVVEHLDPGLLAAFEAAVFGDARPATVVVTTPNLEYNCLVEGLAPGALRHQDHRFEWTRSEFTRWCQTVATRFGYAVTCSGIGPVDEERGTPTQMAVFRR